MPSGCILNDSCPVCGEIVWENDWEIQQDEFMHQGCVSQYYMNKYRMTDKQFEVFAKIPLIKREIKEISQMIKSDQAYCKDRIKKLEQLLGAE